ncbi:unnamed protein product, partial [marine sediment metagenome]
MKSLEIALDSVKPEKLVHNTVKIVKDNLVVHNDMYDLRSFRDVLIIGGGKASAQMTLAIEKLLKDYSKINFKGLINIPNSQIINNRSASSKIRMNLASHPIPDESGVNGTNLMFSYVDNTTKDDLIIFLLSGGGSALLPMPKQDITLADLQETNSLLIASGASIHEINTIRKHLS